MIRLAAVVVLLGFGGAALSAQPPQAASSIAAPVSQGRATPSQLGFEWTVPEQAFESALADYLVNTEFLATGETTTSVPANTMMGFSGETCPSGWMQATDQEDGAPLFFAFGLLVDEDGKPRTSFVRIPACVKQ